MRTLSEIHAYCNHLCSDPEKHPDYTLGDWVRVALLVADSPEDVVESLTNKQHFWEVKMPNEKFAAACARAIRVIQGPGNFHSLREIRQANVTFFKNTIDAGGYVHLKIYAGRFLVTTDRTESEGRSHTVWDVSPDGKHIRLIEKRFSAMETLDMARQAAIDLADELNWQED